MSVVPSGACPDLIGCADRHMGAIHTAEYSDWSFIDVGLATDVIVMIGLKSRVSTD